MARGELVTGIMASTIRPMVMPTGKTFTACSSLTNLAASTEPMAMPMATQAVSLAASPMS